jgi:hypothetical protein
VKKLKDKTRLFFAFAVAIAVLANILVHTLEVWLGLVVCLAAVIIIHEMGKYCWRKYYNKDILAFPVMLLFLLLIFLMLIVMC